GAEQDGGLADHGLQGGERVLLAGGGCGGGDREAGVVVVTAGAIGAAELAVAAAVLGGQGLAAARTFADRGWVIGAGGGLAGHRVPFGSGARVPFIFISDRR